MANKYRGEVPLTVGDKTFTLVYDNNAICALEGVLAMSFAEFAMKTANGTLGVTGTRALLWAGMLAKHESTSLKKCGELMDELGLQATVETCWAGLKHVFPDQEKAGGNGEAAAGTGTAS